MKKIYLIIAYLLTHIVYVVAQNEVIVQDSDLPGAQETTWTSDNTYILDGYVFLEAGGKLTIEAGADTLVAGSAVFNANDYAGAIRALRGDAT